MGRKGFTITELLVVVVIVAGALTAIAFVFQSMVSGWSAGYSRVGQGIAIDRVLESMAKDIRAAVALKSSGLGEIRFSSRGGASYAYYFYHADDTYPPKFDKGLYRLKKAAVAGGIDGVLGYGTGETIAGDLLPPPVSDISVNGSIANIDLSVTSAGSIMRAATQVRRRE